MKIGIVTLFPAMFAALDYGITGRAQKQNLLTLQFWNPRDFTNDPHRTVDDRPYGGGPGMVMKFQPLQAAIQAAKIHLESTPTKPCSETLQSNANKLRAELEFETANKIHTVPDPKIKVAYLSPQGQPFNQQSAEAIVQDGALILVAGRYEGIDERLRQQEIDIEWSIGDFVVSGGELPAMCLIDAVTRLLPGALGDPDSAVQDSFSTGLLDYPHYTRPEKIANLSVPNVLLSGDHQAINRWRLKQALGQTWLRRKDLLQKYRLNAEEEVLLAEFIREYETGVKT